FFSRAFILQVVKWCSNHFISGEAFIMSKRPKNDNITTIIIAIITVVGGGLATGYYGYKTAYNNVWIPITTTQTAEAKLEYRTNFPSTDAVLATPTSAIFTTPTVAPVPTLLPGEDWAGNCISASIWKPYLAGETASSSSMCYDLSEWGIVAERGTLAFASEQSQLSAVEYGIFTPWQNWGQVDFTVKTNRLDNSEIWVGFFQGDTVSSRGIVFVIQRDDMIDIREMPYSKEIVNNSHLKQADGKYNVQVVFQKGEIFVSVDEQNIILNHPLNFGVRNMFIGYRSLPVISLDATIFNLKFTP
ncbi:MAG: hypothetical protein PHQ36_13500, partial [Anaerolineales bacterium]|nr:hypothetical protein [Anaerolineales bacterium]